MNASQETTKGALPPSTSTASSRGNDLDVIQAMIDISADRLVALRTQCATSATLTQQEIRSLETKLVRMFSELLLTKARLCERIPAGGLPHKTSSELKQWLRVVGLSQESLNVCLTRLATLEQLLEQSDTELKELLSNNPSYREEEVRRLTKAMENLRKCRDFLGNGGGGITHGGSSGDMTSAGKTSMIDKDQQLTEHLFWDSWDRHHHHNHHHHHHHHRGSMGNIGVTASPRTHRMIVKQAVRHQANNSAIVGGSSRQSPSTTTSESSLKSATAGQSNSSMLTMMQHPTTDVMDQMCSMPGSTLTLTLTPSPPNSPFTPTTMTSTTASTTTTTIGNFSSFAVAGGSLNGTPQRGKFAGTPPPMKKHQTLLSGVGSGGSGGTPTHISGVLVTTASTGSGSMSETHTGAGGMPLSKSKSNESQFGGSGGHGHHHANSPPSLCGHSNTSTISRSRLHTDPSPDSYSSSASSADIISAAAIAATIESNNNNNNNSNNNNNNNNTSLQVPRSPCTPIVTVGMGHTISHRFTKVFKMMWTCDLCQKQMFFGLKCKECKYRCHKDCEPNVPPSCGLPPEFIDEFKKVHNSSIAAAAQHHAANMINTSPNLSTLGKGRIGGSGTSGSGSGGGGLGRLNKSGGGGTISGHHHHHHQHHHHDSSSPGSSCNSSSPSSPALFNLQHQHGAAGGVGGMHATSNTGGILNSGGTSIYMTGGGGGGSNIMSSSGGGSSSTSSNMLSTPSSFHKNSSQFNFPDVTITSNCNQAIGGTTQTLISSQLSGSDGGGGGGPSSISGCSEMQDYPDTNSLTSMSGSCIGGTTNIGVQQTNNGTASTSTVTSTQGTGGNSITIISTANCNSSSSSNTIVGATVLSSSSSTSAVTIGGGGHSGHSTNTSSHAHHSSHSSVISSIVSTGTFYPRKLSSAGVDKRAPFSDLSDTHKSNDSDKTVSLSGSTSASTDSDRTPVRLDSTEDGDSGNWPRQNSLSLKEWDIPYNDLIILEPIGKGRFGTVHRALWHGDVAVKLLKEDYLGDEHMLEAFKLEVANFKKTRHENLVLFMGACMNPPYLAIVTSLCKGNTLYTYIHSRRDKFTINRTTLVAQQISQGMGYLHARGIIHKDLRTKNIFLENGKVIITDFGLFSSTKLLYCDIGLGVPTGWLCYLAPELMRSLLPFKPSEEILPFSKASDVYSFGTVWYELLCGEFPFKSQPAESVIWQVGRGMKQTLANLQTSRDVKDILMVCWSYLTDDRPEFSTLLTKLEHLPKKRLARSPSHPVQLSRSAESVF